MPHLSFDSWLTETNGQDPEFGPDAREFCRTWAISMCEHDWYLEIDCEEGVSLSCIRCHATADDIYPDGREVLAGAFPVRFGYVLTLSCGFVLVNGEDSDGDYDRWAGPVTAVLSVQEYRDPFGVGPEYDVWIGVDPR